MKGRSRTGFGGQGRHGRASMALATALAALAVVGATREISAQEDLPGVELGLFYANFINIPGVIE